MAWTKHELIYDHPDGQETYFFMQTDGTRYVLSEHPNNQGPHVSNIAPLYGNMAVENNLDVNPKSQPENLQLYVERQDGRFDQWEAKTTKLENTANEPNRFDMKASEWQWKNATQYEHGDLQKQLGAKIEQGNVNFKEMNPEQQNQAFREASLAKTEQSEQLRQAAQEAQYEQMQKQRHQR